MPPTDIWTIPGERDVSELAMAARLVKAARMCVRRADRQLEAPDNSMHSTEKSNCSEKIIFWEKTGLKILYFRGKEPQWLKVKIWHFSCHRGPWTVPSRPRELRPWAAWELQEHHEHSSHWDVCRPTPRLILHTDHGHLTLGETETRWQWHHWRCKYVQVGKLLPF